MENFWFFSSAFAAILLVATGSAKIWAIRSGELVWPVGPNFGWFHLPVWFVVVMEFLGGLVYVFSPLQGITSLVLAILIGSISVGAITLWGQECGCFGAVNPKVGPLHVLTMVILAAFLSTSIFVGPTYQRPNLYWRLFLIFTTVTLTITLLQLIKRKSTQSSRDFQGTSQQWDEIFILTSEDCAMCHALRRLEFREEKYVHWVDKDNPGIPHAVLDAAIGKGYPTAIPVSGGTPVYALVSSGMTSIRELLEAHRNLNAKAI